ncbi:hypothetical protein [Salinimicrobium soli]|uniref:hypothetical protein n=1 Tax=Salinimicrobium soli TaxID=1254399 RepID=UPI003AB0422B
MPFLEGLFFCHSDPETSGEESHNERFFTSLSFVQNDKWFYCHSDPETSGEESF